MFIDQEPFTPSPSPPSSPAPCTDSSPPSSPGPEPISLNSPPPSPHLSHPFAASVKATRAPPLYEKKKKRATPPSTPPPEVSVKRPRHAYRRNVEAYMTPFSPPLEDGEAAIWDEAISNVVDGGHGAVTLTNQNLTHIPKKFISDLDKFFVPPEKSERINASPNSSFSLLAPSSAPGGRLFTRVNTAPARSSPFSRNLTERTRSIADVTFGLPREEVQLFLSGNQIRSLPLELFDLQKMTVLTLRANLLTHLPPEIAHLRNLRELNVSNNRLTYLPSEMIDMSLAKLHIYPNPFLADPAENQTRPLKRSNTRTTLSNSLDDTRHHRHASPTTHTLPRVIPLLELCLRSLFSPSHRNTDDECVLESQYELPLYEYPFHPDEPLPPPGKKRIHRVIPQHIRDVLDVCVPGSVDVDDAPVYDDKQPQKHQAWSAQSEDAKVTGIGTCPSPRHLTLGDGTRRVFARHAEERWTWEEMIAGVAVGGSVPVRWRGCQWGCLDFLDPNKDDEGLEDKDSEEEELSEDGDVEMEVVQLVQFNSGGFDMEGFED